MPFDQAVTNRPGTRLGPRAIREASALQASGRALWLALRRDERAGAIVDYGDLAFDYAKRA